MTNSSKVLVTGSSGFIGSHLCEALKAKRYEVIGLARSADALRVTDRHHKVDLYYVDKVDLARWLRGVDAVVHLAARAGMVPSWTEFGDYARSNIEATQKLLETMVSTSARRLVYVSSSSVYGRMAVNAEDGPFAPVSPYGVTKLAGEVLCKAYAESYGLKLTIIRPFSVYGPRQRPDMMHHIFIRKLLAGKPITVDGDGSQSRSNTYVSDLVGAILLALWNVDAEGQAFNVGGDDCTSVLDTLRLLESITNKEADIRYGPARVGDQAVTRADTARLRRILGWAPVVSLEEGLAKQVEWQRGQA